MCLKPEYLVLLSDRGLGNNFLATVIISLFLMTGISG